MATHPTRNRFSPTETLGFGLAIIGLVVGAIWLVVTSIHHTQRVGNADMAIIQIMQGVRGLYGPVHTVAAAGNITASVIKAGAVPPEYVNGNIIYGPLPGSTINILANSATDNAFTIEIQGIDQPTCTAMLSTLGGPQHSDGMTLIGSTVASGPIVVGQMGKPLPLSMRPIMSDVTPLDAEKACSPNDWGNFIQFEYNL